MDRDLQSVRTREPCKLPHPPRNFYFEIQVQKNLDLPPKTKMAVTTTHAVASMSLDTLIRTQVVHMSIYLAYFIYLFLIESIFLSLQAASNWESVRIISFGRSFILVWPAPNIQRWWKHIRQHASEDKQLPLEAKHPISVRVMCVIIQPPSSPSSSPSSSCVPGYRCSSGYTLNNNGGCLACVWAFCHWRFVQFGKQRFVSASRRGFN